MCVEVFHELVRDAEMCVEEVFHELVRDAEMCVWRCSMNL